MSEISLIDLLEKIERLRLLRSYDGHRLTDKERSELWELEHIRLKLVLE